MFEKFHSYAFLQILHAEMQDLHEEERKFLRPMTIHEKQWLVDALEKQETPLFLSEETVRKLKNILKQDIPQPSPAGWMMEKGKPASTKADENLPFWTHQIMQKQAVTCRMGDEPRETSILPIKLEYSIKQAEWKVSGVEIHDLSLVNIPLQQIADIREYDLNEEQYETFYQAFFQKLEESREKAVILLNREVFSDHPIEDEKLRILYALSSFDKEVAVDENDERFYQITIYYYPQDYAHLLSVIQLLGHRIEVLAPAALRQTVKDIARKAFERYQENE